MTDGKFMLDVSTYRDEPASTFRTKFEIGMKTQKLRRPIYRDLFQFRARWRTYPLHTQVLRQTLTLALDSGVVCELVRKGMVDDLH